MIIIIGIIIIVGVIQTWDNKKISAQRDAMYELQRKRDAEYEKMACTIQKQYGRKKLIFVSG